MLLERPLPSASILPTHAGADRADRPMLARAADSTYWMSRYAERAEHVARVLLVNTNLLIDVGELARGLRERQWMGVLKTFHLDECPPGHEPLGERCVRFLTFDPLNPNSLVTTLTRARENARAIRESISAEMWECLNTLYWSVNAEDAASRYEDDRETFCDAVMNGSMLFQGLTDQTLAHDQRWLFTQAAKYLERVDVTCRVIETRYEILQGEGAMYLDTPVRNIHWMAVLRMCCAIEAYRRQHLNDLDPMRIVAFLIFEADFPRSLRFCVEHAAAAVARLRRLTGGASVDPAERALGRLATHLGYSQPSDLSAAGVTGFLSDIRERAEEAAGALQMRYFLH